MPSESLKTGKLRAYSLVLRVLLVFLSAASFAVLILFFHSAFTVLAGLADFSGSSNSFAITGDMVEIRLENEGFLPLNISVDMASSGKTVSVSETLLPKTPKTIKLSGVSGISSAKSGPLSLSVKLSAFNDLLSMQFTTEMNPQ